MAVTIAGRSLGKVGIIGSGQIGPDIALHFAKVLQPHDGTVVVVDISQSALDAGQKRLHKKIARGEKSGAFKPARAQAMRDAVTFTSDYEALRGAELVVEAASEDLPLKGRIFAQAAELATDGAILLSNSSHLEPERIFANLADRSATAVAHYFFPAERNPVVEIIPGVDTSDETVDWLCRFYEWSGKIPIRVSSRYGYAVDPIFEGVFEAACLAVEEELGSVKEVDFMARAALGMTVGPFTAMNLTGGNPITDHGLREMHERLGPWFDSPALLRNKLETEGPTGMWPVCGRGESAHVEGERGERIVAALRAAYLGLCFEVVDSGIIALDDYELALAVALDQVPPCKLANRLGVGEALAMVQRYAADHPGFPVSTTLQAQAALGQPFDPSQITEEDLLLDNGGVVRLLRIRRPKVLNALDATTYRQLSAAIDSIATAPHVLGAVISGFGNKAFVSGADIRALHKVRTPQDGYALAKVAHDLAARIDALDKPVVAALNGVALGGGLELALACDGRIGVAGLRVLCGLPEVNLGIIPAGGGTQRLTRLIGWQRSHPLLRTGKALSSTEALALGVISHAAPADALVATAVAMVAHMAAGNMRLPPMPAEPVEGAPETLPAVDIGHGSRAVDALLCEAIAGGLRLSLTDGLKLELEVFKRICQLEDMRIGVDNFVANGPRVPAEFVHA